MEGEAEQREEEVLGSSVSWEEVMERKDHIMARIHEELIPVWCTSYIPSNQQHKTERPTDLYNNNAEKGPRFEDVNHEHTDHALDRLSTDKDNIMGVMNEEH